MVWTPQHPRAFRKPNRLPVRTNRQGDCLQPHEMTTFTIAADGPKHRRKATCEEVRCPDFLKGWRVHVEAVGPELAHTARTSGRKHQEVHAAEGETWLVFEAGQRCFRASQHTTRVEDVPELLLIGRGDWRRIVERPRKVSAGEWTDTLGSNVTRLGKILENRDT